MCVAPCAVGLFSYCPLVFTFNSYSKNSCIDVYMCVKFTRISLVLSACAVHSIINWQIESMHSNSVYDN